MFNQFIPTQKQLFEGMLAQGLLDIFGRIEAITHINATDWTLLGVHPLRMRKYSDLWGVSAYVMQAEIFLLKSTKIDKELIID